MTERVDIAVVGAGAAGLMAAIWAARSARAEGTALRVVTLDGARTIGAKILVAGGGRCNVTHEAADERDFAGGSSNAIRQVLRRFPVQSTIRFFADLGVELKREETGKLFPTTDRARTVLDALLRALAESGAELRFPWRVESIVRCDGGFTLRRDDGATIDAARVILATGGCSLPKSGSDGHGHALARALGHTITPHVLPALVPLVLAAEHPLRALAGIAAPARVEVRASTGRRVHSSIGSVLCTHFGLSGPAILDVSRHLATARLSDPGATLHLGWLPELDEERFDLELADRSGASSRGGPMTPLRRLRSALPERLAETICTMAGVDPHMPVSQLAKAARRAFVRTVCAMEVPVVGDRGFTHAEVTAGGVPLDEVTIATMASRRCPGLSLCGEVLDVDGRIGGFNFQWAWASGFVAGNAAAREPGRAP